MPSVPASYVWQYGVRCFIGSPLIGEILSVVSVFPPPMSFLAEVISLDMIRALTTPAVSFHQTTRIVCGTDNLQLS